MQIKQRLTYQFVGSVALILLISSFAIYFFSANYRQEDFYNRLLSKATNTAKLLIEIEEVDANLLKIIEKDNPVNLYKESIVIYNYKNEILYQTPDIQRLNVHQKFLNDVRLKQKVRIKQLEYEILGFLFADKYDRFVVIIGASDIFGFKKLKNLRWVLFFVFGFSIVLAYISGRIYAGRAMQPIKSVIDQVNNISITSLNLKVNEGNGKDEIASLAKTFNNMLGRLETAFNIQKNFIANASHELRTPLTIITGQLEVALLKERKNQEYQEIIHSVLEDMKNLNSISNRLLMLAQTGSESSKFDFKPIRIDDIVWQARVELLKMQHNYKIIVTLENDQIDEKQLTILGNEHLIKIAILNLMENGCKYSSDNQVIVKINFVNKSSFIQFINEGIGIDPRDFDQIFEPFNRGRNVTAIKGHGIGLSLAERIIKLHEGNISLSSKLNEGATFSISLPIHRF